MQQPQWKEAENTPVTPKHLGTKAFLDFPIEDVIEYIDWNPFFQVGPVSVSPELCHAPIQLSNPCIWAEPIAGNA